MPSLDFADVIDRADVRVPERRGGAGLAIEPLEQFPRLVVVETRSLKSHLAMQLGVLGQIDDPHGPLAQRLDRAVASELDGEWSRGRGFLPLPTGGDRFDIVAELRVSRQIGRARFAAVSSDLLLFII